MALTKSQEDSMWASFFIIGKMEFSGQSSPLRSKASFEILAASLPERVNNQIQSEEYRSHIDNSSIHPVCGTVLSSHKVAPIFVK
jgi:hypothetical protein